MGDDWLAAHQEAERQAQAAEARRAESAASMAALLNTQLEFTRQETAREAKAMPICPNHGIPTTIPGMCQLCVADAQQSTPQVPLYTEATTPTWLPIDDVPQAPEPGGTAYRKAPRPEPREQPTAPTEQRPPTVEPRRLGERMRAHVRRAQPDDHPGRRKHEELLREFLKPAERVPTAAPPSTQDDLREALASALHPPVDPDIPKFFCVNCSTHVVVPGICASCGQLLRSTDQVADLYWGAFEPELHFVDAAYAVDMRDIAGQNQDVTSLGYPRDARAFWWVMLAEHPHLFSKENVDRIDRRQAPEVDDQWVEYHPGQVYYLHDRLIHHHWDQGPWAFGVPEHFHTQFHKLLHPL